MASLIYPKFKEAILTNYLAAGTPPTLTGGLKLALVDLGTYTYSAAHDFYNDVTGVVGTPQEVLNPTFTNGTVDDDGSNVSYATLTGDSVEALILYADTGTAATSPLIAIWDSSTGLPFTPDGTTVPVTFNASGLFTL